MKKVVTKFPLSRRVEVDWRDSASRGGWDTVEHHRAYSKVGPMRSIGYLLKKDKDVIQLAQSMSSLTEHVADTVTIPRENITRIRTVR